MMSNGEAQEQGEKQKKNPSTTPSRGVTGYMQYSIIFLIGYELTICAPSRHLLNAAINLAQSDRSIQHTNSNVSENPPPKTWRRPSALVAVVISLFSCSFQF